jgi:hypothetical protein
MHPPHRPHTCHSESTCILWPKKEIHIMVQRRLNVPYLNPSWELSFYLPCLIFNTSTSDLSYFEGP